MRTIGDDERCPCGAGTYGSCCGPLHAGAPAPTALALMRSRFAAFALGDAAHLLASHHPSTRPRELLLDESLEWRRLQIVDTARGGPDDADGVVEFRAAFRSVLRPPGTAGVVHERSRFSRDRGRWAYVDGEQPG